MIRKEGFKQENLNQRDMFIKKFGKNALCGEISWSQYNNIPHNNNHRLTQP